jgi:tRNA (guanine6-N2)-methyltransferase
MSEKLFFLTTRGLEAVSANEIATLPAVTLGSIGYRRITASCAGSLAPLLDLRTIDDVFLDLSTWRDIGRHRRTLAFMRELSSLLDLRAAASKVARLRDIPQSPAFSVTANFVGKRNYGAEEIKSAVCDGIVTYHDWRYTDDDGAADLNVRVFIEGETAFVGLRLGGRPLHDREYKKAHRAGSLKPPVAAAMLRLVGIAPGQSLLDPCCGAGTILAEAGGIGAGGFGAGGFGAGGFGAGGFGAGEFGAVVWGADIDTSAVSAARQNVDAAGVDAIINAWDARALPIPDRSVDRIVSNLPWGLQTPVCGDLALFYRDVCAEMRRVLAPGGRIALLTNAPQLAPFRDLRCDNRLEISLYGQTPTILTFSRGENDKSAS